jgi:hypothetical protein
VRRARKLARQDVNMFERASTSRSFRFESASPRCFVIAILVAATSACASIAPDLNEADDDLLRAWNAETPAPSDARASDPQTVYVQVPPGPPPVYVQVPGPPPPGYVVLQRPVGPPLALAAKPGFYLTGSAIGGTQSGDLDGESFLVGPALVALPDVDWGAGFQAGGGWRVPADAFEITYEQSWHSGSFLGVTHDSTIHAVNFDWKHYFRIAEKLQPFTLLGMNIPWADLDDAAKAGPRTGDATLYGWGMNFGGGAAYYMTPQLSLVFSGMFRFMDFFDVSALGFSGSLSDSVFSSGWKFTLGTAYTF